MKAKNRLPEEYNELKNRLAEVFRTKVEMTYSQKGKGKIILSFANEEELEHLISLFDRMKG